MTTVVVTPDFRAWLRARGMIESESPPVLWGQIALYEHEREVGMWTAGTPSEDT